MNGIYPTCKHRWSDINTSFFDRKHWIVVRRCRRCSNEQQLEYKIIEKNGVVRTESRITPIISIVSDTVSLEEQKMKDNIGEVKT